MAPDNPNATPAKSETEATDGDESPEENNFLRMRRLRDSRVVTKRRMSNSDRNSPVWIIRQSSYCAKPL